MKELFKNYLVRFLLIFIIFLVVNLCFFVIGFSMINNYGIDTEKTIEYIDSQLDEINELSPEAKAYLDQEKIWMMLLNSDGKIISSYRLPDSLNHSYDVLQVANFSKWDLEGYPVLEKIREKDILVIGYKQDEFLGIHITKLFYITDSKFINGLIVIFATLFVCNILASFLLFRRNSKSIEKKVEEEFRKKDEARAKWINGITHDIRTPMSVILGYSSSLTDSLQREHEKEQAQIICAQAGKVKELIIDINLVSKLEYAMQPLRKEQVDLLELMRNILINYMENKYGAYEIIPDLPEYGDYFIYGDASLLKRMIENLINNCISHNEADVDIHVALQKKEEKFHITISDNGSGMTEEQLTELNSDKSISLENMYASNGDSAHGVGLQLVKDIVKAHEGKIWFSSNESGGIFTMIIL